MSEAETKMLELFDAVSWKSNCVCFEWVRVKHWHARLVHHDKSCERRLALCTLAFQRASGSAHGKFADVLARNKEELWELWHKNRQTKLCDVLTEDESWQQLKISQNSKNPGPNSIPQKIYMNFFLWLLNVLSEKNIFATTTKRITNGVYSKERQRQSVTPRNLAGVTHENCWDCLVPYQ